MKTKPQRKAERRARRKQRRLDRLHADHGGDQVLTAVDVEGSVSLEAAEGDGADKLRKFKMIAYKGGRLFVARFYHPAVVELTGLRVKKQQLAALLNHDFDRPVGHTNRVAIEARQITAEGVVSGANEHARQVIESSAAGFPWQSSIGMRMDKVDFIAEGESAEVNGRTFKGPIYVVRSGVLNEISFTPVGGDEDGASARVSASADQHGGIAMKFEQWLKAKGFDLATLNAAQKTFFQAQFDQYTAWLKANHFDVAVISGDQNTSLTAMFDAHLKAGGQPVAPPANTPPAPPAPGPDPLNAHGGGPDPLVEFRRQQAAEVERCRQIREICAQFGQPVMKINNQEIALEAHAIAENWTLDKTKLEALQSSRGAPSIQAHSHDAACTLEAMEAASLVASGVALDNKHFGALQARAVGLPDWMGRSVNDDQRQRIMEAGHRFSQLSSVDICREAIRLDGRMVPSGEQNIIRASFSGSALLRIWTTNVNARLIARFLEAGDSTVGWCQEADVPDFRTNDRPRVLKGGRLNKHARGKAADHHSGDDTMESYRIARYSKQFFVDEMDIIDDRLMALQDVIDEMAKGSSRLRPDLVYAILMGNPDMADEIALFHADHGNLDDSSAVLDATHLKEAITRMGTMRENGVNLNLQPTHLVSSKTLSFDAAQAINSNEVREPAATGGGTKNVLHGAVGELRSDARIDNGVIDPDTGVEIAGDPTAFFLISADGPTIEVGYRRGTGRAPSSTTWKKNGEDGVWGVGASVNMDVGAKALAYQAMQKLTA